MIHRKLISALIAGCFIAAAISATAIYLARSERASALSTSAPRLLPLDITHDWVPYGGSWRENAGTIENDSEERGAKLMYGTQSGQDYFIEADVQLLGSSGDAGLIIRGSGEEEGVDSYHGYFAGIRNKDDVMLLGRADFGWDQYAAVPLPAAIHMGDWYHLTMVAKGCNIAFSVADDSGHTTRTFVKDAQCISSGGVGLKSYSSGARWRNIRVGPADRDVFEIIAGNEVPVVIGAERTPFAVGFTDQALDRYMGPIRREATKQHFNAETRSIASLKALDPQAETPATIHGVVTITSPALFIQDSTGSIAVETVAPLSAEKIGDEVEVQGSVILRNFTPFMRRATVRLLWTNVPLSPLAVSAFELAAGGHNGSLVELEGTFVSSSGSQNGTTRLAFSDDTQQFYVLAESSSIKRQLRSLPSGSRVRLSGVVTYRPDFTLKMVPFAILLPPSRSLEVIAYPSWWNPQHIFLVIAAVLGFILVLQILFVRIQRWRLQAVLSERERLAMDMHDTLAQSFAGIGFQLQAVRDETPISGPSRQHVEMAIAMVRSSHEEAKRSISALRPEYLGKSDIVEALCDYAKRIVDGQSISVVPSIKGREVNIPLQISDALFRIGEEAISNAIRHARPSALAISLVFDTDIACLSITDDGCGFSSDLKHVGLGMRGMEKRARNIGASLKIASEVGQGTTVKITVTLNSHRTVLQRLENVLDFVAGA